MVDSVIEVKNLRKIYKRIKRKWILFKVGENIVEAVRGISFSVERGEIVALLGPNGSGKSTTIKILTGVLHPTEGNVSVLGYTPWERKKDYLRQIGVIFGQRTSLIWEVPVRDTYELYREIYKVPREEYEDTFTFLDRYLGIGEYLDVPARRLSLGERMRCELGLILLHRPKVVFLDEPTVGIDVWTREKIKEMLRRVREEWGTTIIYTTHQMGDIEGLVDRVILVNEGRIIFDGKIYELMKMVPYKFLSVEFAEKIPDLGYEVIERAGNYVKYRVPRDDAKNAVEDVLRYEIVDLSLEEPDLEAVLREIVVR